VEVLLGNPVTKIDDAVVTVGGKHIPTGAVVWAAGVAASLASRWLGANHDKAGRVIVESDLSVPGQPDVFVIGDTASVRTDQGTLVPGIAPAAKQMGRFFGKLIDAQTRGCAKPDRFVYRHQGDMATIGRGAAVVRISNLQLRGFAAWSFWGVVHIYFLIGVRIWDYVTFSRRARLITNALPDHN
jgi:NADH dehydrogenase